MSRFLVYYNDIPAPKVLNCRNCDLRDEIAKNFNFLDDDFDLIVWNEDFKTWVMVDSVDEISTKATIKIVSSLYKQHNFTLQYLHK